MFSHVMIGTNAMEKAKTFYDALLATLDVPEGWVHKRRCFWRTPAGVFAVSEPINGEPASVANGGTIGFACSSPEQVNAWHAAGLAAGGTAIEDPPGEREGPLSRMHLAYLRDLDGNKLCAMYRYPKA